MNLAPPSLDGWDKMALEGITRFTLWENRADNSLERIKQLIE